MSKKKCKHDKKLAWMSKITKTIQKEKCGSSNFKPGDMSQLIGEPKQVHLPIPDFSTHGRAGESKPKHPNQVECKHKWDKACGYKLCKKCGKSVSTELNQVEQNKLLFIHEKDMKIKELEAENSKMREGLETIRTYAIDNDLDKVYIISNKSLEGK